MAVFEENEGDMMLWDGFRSKNDKPDFLQYHIDPRNRGIILETSYSS